jgi:hypothetical protein
MPQNTMLDCYENTKPTAAGCCMAEDCDGNEQQQQQQQQPWNISSKFVDPMREIEVLRAKLILSESYAASLEHDDDDTALSKKYHAALDEIETLQQRFHEANHMAQHESNLRREQRQKLFLVEQENANLHAELSEFRETQLELIDLTNRLVALSSTHQSYSDRKNKEYEIAKQQLLTAQSTVSTLQDKLQHLRSSKAQHDHNHQILLQDLQLRIRDAEEALQSAKHDAEINDQKYSDLLNYAKENLNQAEEEKVMLRKELANERRKQSVMLCSTSRSDEEMVADVVTELLQVEENLLHIEPTGTDDVPNVTIPSMETEVSTPTTMILRDVNHVSGVLQEGTTTNVGTVPSTSEPITAPTIQSLPCDTSSLSKVYQLQNQILRQECTMKLLRNDRINLQCQLDHMRWTLWDLEEYRNCTRQKMKVFTKQFHRLNESEQRKSICDTSIQYAEALGETEKLRHKVQHLETLSRLLRAEVDKKNRVICEMSTLCAPSDATRCVYMEQERSLKMAAGLSVALAESQMKVDELNEQISRKLTNGSPNEIKCNAIQSSTDCGRNNIAIRSRDSSFSIAKKTNSSNNSFSTMCMRSFSSLTGTSTVATSTSTNGDTSSNSECGSSKIRGMNSSWGELSWSCNSMNVGLQHTAITVPHDRNQTSNSSSISLEPVLNVAVPKGNNKMDNNDTEEVIRTLKNRIMILENENNAFYSTKLLFSGQ